MSIQSRWESYNTVGIKDDDCPLAVRLIFRKIFYMGALACHLEYEKISAMFVEDGSDDEAGSKAIDALKAEIAERLKSEMP